MSKKRSRATIFSASLFTCCYHFVVGAWKPLIVTIQVHACYRRIYMIKTFNEIWILKLTFSKIQACRVILKVYLIPTRYARPLSPSSMSLPPSPNKLQVRGHLTHITHSIITILHAAKIYVRFIEFKDTEVFNFHGGHLLKNTIL